MLMLDREVFEALFFSLTQCKSTTGKYSLNKIDEQGRSEEKKMKLLPQ